MLALRRQILFNAFKLLDLAGVLLWFLLAAAAEAYEMGVVSLADFLAMRFKIQNFAIFVGFLFAWHAILRSFGLYQSKRLASRRRELLDVVKAATLGTMVIVAAGMMFRIHMVNPVFISVFWVGVTMTMVLSRILLRMLLAQLRKRGRNLRNVVVVGTNSRALAFARKLESRLELGYRVVGFVDEDARAHSGEVKAAGYLMVAGFEGFSDYLKDHVVDEVAICLPMKSFYRQSAQIIAICEEHGVIVRVPAQLFDLKLAKSRMENLESEPVATIYTGTMEGLPTLMKRAIDFCVSLILLTVLTPVFMAIAILMKITSEGPVFFAQDRIGLNKRRFKLYKFRTMVKDAEKRMAELEHLNEVKGPAFKIKNDPRMTPIGRFLRKRSIDELPQLFNVLKGDMALVGPRPLPVRDYEGFDEDWHRRRFSVRPGITCTWQCNGRSNVSFENWMKLDMEYIDHWSLWLDFKILIQTIPAVLKGSGAA
jgi:exopolysaccharide biosynthesis polyprenyl glycosylphosphotransferase